MRGRATWAMLLLGLTAATGVNAQEPAQEPAERDVAQAGSPGPLRAPTVGVSIGYARDHLSVDLPSGTLEETNALWHTRATLGLGYDVTRLSPAFVLAGHSELGFGLSYEPGDWLVHTRHTLQPQWAPNDTFRLGLGLAVAAHVNTGRLSHSYADVGLPLTARLAFVELVYTPLLTMPLGRDTEPVFGGERSERMAVGIVPVQLDLRFRIDPLGW